VVCLHGDVAAMGEGKEMTITKKRLVPLVIIAAIVISLFGWIRFATATSEFDSNYNTEDVIEITSTPAVGCPAYDLSSDWYSYFKSLTTAQTHFSSQATLDAYKASFDIALQQGGSWGVSTQLSASAPQYQTVNVMWSEVAGANITFSGTNVILNRANNQNSLRMFTFIIKGVHDGGGSCVAEWVNPTNNNTSIIISTQTTVASPIRNAFYGGDYTVSYPIGYAGKPIKSVYNPPDTFYPDFTYTVDILEFTAQYLGNVPYTNTSLVNLRWRIVGKDNAGLYNQIIADIDTPEEVAVNYTFETTGDYEIWLDYEINPPGQLDPPDKVKTMVQRIKVDGSTYTSSTTQSECTSGVCNQPDIYEDCTTFGANIVSGFSCVMRNFGIYLRGVLTNLFVPSGLFIRNYFNSLNAFLQEKLGMLVYPITFIISTFNEFITAANTPSCTVSPSGTFFGASMNINFCLIENNMPAIWNGFITFIRALTVYVVVMALYRKFMVIMKGHHE